MATSYLPLLPPEVWTQAWNLVCSQEDLKSLGLTCCLFRSICQNRLFKEIRFSCEPSTSSTAIYRDPLTMCYPEWKERIKQGVQRMEGLSRHPAHKYSVTTMKLKGTEDLTISDLEEAFPREGVSEFYQTLVSSFLLALESFTNLRHVHLGPSITITDEFVHALSRLPNLDELVIRGPFLTSIASPMIAVKVLRLSDNKDGVSGLGLFSGQRMTSLNLRNITSPDSLLRHEIARQEVNFLTCLVLQVEISQVPAIFSFLPSCRNLERLVISPFARTFENEHPLYRIPSLPRDSLPRLSSYIGPVKLAQSILPGRPVIDIEITGLHRRELLVRREYYGWDVETLEDTFLRPLRQTSVPLRRLYAPLLALSDKMLEVICRYFPQLQSLELGLDYRTIRRSKITKEGKRLMAFLQENDPSTDFNSYLAQNETGLPDSLEASPFNFAATRRFKMTQEDKRLMAFL
ncbi:hypothetical protein CPC08DRAFT_801026 [Agrocybe pediades]|nr:hypothetical protein CPC08DRAFT_801026 [Agrocybe pediades]